MKIKHIKKLLTFEIQKVAKSVSKYCFHPKNDLVRKRKLPAEVLIKTVIGMESKSLTNELVDLFHSSPDMPSAPAFSQQRCKLKPKAFKAVFDGFTSDIRGNSPDKLPALAVDGPDIQIATNPKDKDSYFPGTNGQKGYNLLHLNALYDLSHHIYTDTVIQKRLDWNEHSALQKMTGRSNIPQALVIADRGYESYNNLAHIQEKGWFFLIRIKDGKTGIKSSLDLPYSDTFDIPVSLKLTRKQTNETKQLYVSHWGIETSFRDLKYTVGMLNFHSKKVMCIQQEIYTRLIMYNFAEMITSYVVIEKKQRKYTYKSNFSVAVHMCRLYLYRKTTLPDLEAIIARNLIPVRPERHRTRYMPTITQSLFFEILSL